VLCDRPCDGKSYGKDCEGKCKCFNNAACNPQNGKSNGWRRRNVGSPRRFRGTRMQFRRRRGGHLSRNFSRTLHFAPGRDARPLALSRLCVCVPVCVTRRRHVHVCGWLHWRALSGTLQKGPLRQRLQPNVRLRRRQHRGLRFRYRPLQLQARMARFVDHAFSRWDATTSSKVKSFFWVLI